MSQSQNSLLDQYKSSVQLIRTLYLNVPTRSGRPSRGPRYIAITRCTRERDGPLGLTTSKMTKGQRWACNTCMGLVLPVWADGPLPDEEDIKDEYHDWMAKGRKRNVRTEFL